jgi:hypothetical protein
VAYLLYSLGTVEMDYSPAAAEVELENRIVVAVMEWDAGK